MSSDIITPLAEQVAEFITAMTGVSTGHQVTGYVWERKAYDAKLPVGVVGLPIIRRTQPGDRESEIGLDDWGFEFPVGLLFEYDESVAVQQLAVEVVEKFISAVDADPALGTANGDGNVIVYDDSSVVEAEPEVYLEQPRALLIYRCTLVVNAGVPSP